MTMRFTVPRPRQIDSRCEENSMFTKDAFSTPLAPYQTMRTAPATMNPPDMAAFAELLAKVEELLNRPAERWETVLSVGPLHLDLLTRSVRRGERPIELRPREFRLLEYMMRHKEQVLTRAMLFQEVWNYKFVPESNLVDVHMGRLRRKIDQDDEWPMIYNIRGRGFVLREPQLFAVQARENSF